MLKVLYHKCEDYYEDMDLDVSFRVLEKINRDPTAKAIYEWITHFTENHMWSANLTPIQFNRLLENIDVLHELTQMKTKSLNEFIN